MCHPTDPIGSKSAAFSQRSDKELALTHWMRVRKQGTLNLVAATLGQEEKRPLWTTESTPMRRKDGAGLGPPSRAAASGQAGCTWQAWKPSRFSILRVPYHFSQFTSEFLFLATNHILRDTVAHRREQPIKKGAAHGHKANHCTEGENASYKDRL